MKSQLAALGAVLACPAIGAGATLVSPAANERVPSATPTFTWTLDAPTWYSNQGIGLFIARKPDVDSVGALTLRSMILSRALPTQASFTLDEQLPAGAVYWQVSESYELRWEVSSPGAPPGVGPITQTQSKQVWTAPSRVIIPIEATPVARYAKAARRYDVSLKDSNTGDGSVVTVELALASGGTRRGVSRPDDSPTASVRLGTGITRRERVKQVRVTVTSGEVSRTWRLPGFRL